MTTLLPVHPGAVFTEFCEQASTLLEGISLVTQVTKLALPQDHVASPNLGKVGQGALHLDATLVAMQLPINSWTMVQEVERLSQHPETLSYIDRINGIRNLIFEHMCGLLGDICDTMILLADYATELPADALHVLASISAVAGVAFALNELIKTTYALTGVDSLSNREIGILVAKEPRNLLKLAVGILMIVTVIGGITLISPWIVLALTIARFTLDLGILFAEKISQTPSSAITVRI